jgi:pimeloyl-ACP methyl ester carboxylesterase
MAAKRIYCISGLGADHRIFRKLSVNGYQFVPVPWVPFDKHDDLPCYAQKLAVQITDEQPVILGLSFGGMLAVEIAKLRPVQHTILVSSAKTQDELGDPGGLVKFIIKSKIVPASFLTTPNRFVLERFGVTTEEEKELLRDIIRTSDGDFMKWALKALLRWRNHTVPKNLVDIHGTADQIIPAAHVHPNHWIKGGTHFMVYSRAAEISKIIEDVLQ